MKQKHSTIAFLCMILPACLAASAFRWGAGIWMILPIYPLCVAFSSVLARYFPTKFWLRAAFFPVMTSLLNMMVSDSTSDAVVSAGVAVASFALAEWAVYLWFDKRALHRAGSVAVGVVCILLGVVFFGNPFSALKAQRILNDYIEQHYNTEDGGHHFGAIRYDHRAKCYALSAYNDKFPTETYHLLAVDEFVVDHYRDLLEDQETRDEALTITKKLRESFGTDMFSVVQMGIDNFDRSLVNYSIHHDTDYAKDMNFCIRLSGKPTFEKFFDAAVSYHTVLEASDLEYGQLLYVGGEGLRYRIALTIPAEDDIFDRKIHTSVYLLRHHENHLYLQENGILELIDRNLKNSMFLYE